MNAIPPVARTACLPRLRRAASTPHLRGTCGRGSPADHARFSFAFRAPSSLRADRAAPRPSSSLAGVPRDPSRGRERGGRASVPGLKPSSGCHAVPFPGATDCASKAGKAGARRRPERPAAPPVILRGAA